MNNSIDKPHLARGQDRLVPGGLERQGPVRAVERALELVEVFARSRGPLSLTELSAVLQLAPSTVHRLVQTLMSLGYVVQYRQSKRYGVGPGIAGINRAMLLKYEFPQFAGSHLSQLVQVSGETACLAGLYGPSVIVLNQLESTALVRVSNPIGGLLPLHCTAVGKIFMADFSPVMLAEVVQHVGLPAHTPFSLQTPDRLLAELATVRDQGYATETEEFALGATSVAVGIRGSSGAVVAALGIWGPVARLTPDRVADLVPQLLQTAHGFGQQIREP